MADTGNFGLIYCSTNFGDIDQNVRTLAPDFVPDCLTAKIGAFISNVGGTNFVDSITIDTTKILISESTRISHL